MPIMSLVIDNDAGSKGTWGTTRKGVKVTGVFGWSLLHRMTLSKPCKIQAVRWFMRAKQGYQDAGANQNLGEMYFMKELDPDVKTILQRYKIFQRGGDLMSIIDDAIARLQYHALAISSTTVRGAPSYPVEDATVLPLAITYISDGTGSIDDSTTARLMTVDFHVNRMSMKRLHRNSITFQNIYADWRLIQL